MDIIESIRCFVEKECNKSTSKYGVEPYEFHFVPTVQYSLQLAKELNADKEVVALGAWLHDIGSIIEGRENHHISGAKIAEEKLKELNYPIDKIELVKKCILNHRGSQNNNRETLEEKIISEADSMSNFDNIPGIFKASFNYENMTQDEARVSVLKKLENKYNQLHFSESKRIIKPKYEAIKLLLS